MLLTFQILTQIRNTSVTEIVKFKTILLKGSSDIDESFMRNA